MEHSHTWPLPAWVRKRDGRLMPFEADKISRALFAATETVGRPDVFTARELTDGILHFLVSEGDSSQLSTSQIADLVIKVVRELGHPALSQVFADFSAQRSRTRSTSPQGGSGRDQPVEPLIRNPLASGLDPRSSALDACSLARRAGQACLQTYSLREVFARDLVAAHTEGLLTLTGLAHPLELAGCVLGAPGPTREGLVEVIEEARAFSGEFLVLDGPEYRLLVLAPSRTGSAGNYARELGIGLRATGLRAVVNLNLAAPPSWADELADGPLFAQRRLATPAEEEPAQADLLLDQLLLTESAKGRLRMDWHLGERDFAATQSSRLLRVGRLAAEGAALAFVFDRPRRPVHLAEGLDRSHPAVLLRIGLHLPRLAQQPGLHSDPALFLQKLGSLARLALSAAVQKRDFVRRYNRNRPAFLVDRARLVVVPVGLDAVVRELLGLSLGAGAPALDFARRLILRLREVLATDGAACRIETCIDSAAGFSLDEPFADDSQSLPSVPRVAGLTAWEPDLAPTQQLQAAGPLHAAAEMGTVAVLVPGGRSITAEEVVELLRHAWQQTAVVRLRLVRMGRPQRQLMAPWEDSSQRPATRGP